MNKTDERLKLALSLTIDWLEFAEAKNAILLSASAAAIFGLLALLRSPDFITNDTIYACISLSILLFSISLIHCSLSFIPVTSTVDSTNNLLSYSDIVKYDSKKYLKTLYDQEKNENEKPSSFNNDLADLVVSYSKITMRKYSLFNRAIWFALSAIVIPFATLSILFFLNTIQ